MVQTEKKGVVLMQDFGAQTFIAWELVRDSLEGTLFPAKPFLLADKLHLFLGCEQDVDCLQKSTGSLMVIYATQVLNNSPGLTSSESMMEAARVYSTWQP